MQAAVSTIYVVLLSPGPEAAERRVLRPGVSPSCPATRTHLTGRNSSKSKRRPGNKPLTLQSLTSLCSSSPPALLDSASQHLEKSSPQSKQSNSCPPATAISISITRFLGIPPLKRCRRKRPKLIRNSKDIVQADHILLIFM